MTRTTASGLCILLAAAVSAESPASHAADGDNVALGKSYVVSRAPDYPLCTDAGDATDLTDGHYITDPQTGFWGEKGTVGWSQPRDPIAITIDLETVAAIRGIRYHTAAGSSGVTFPSMVELAISDDGETFHEIGELYRLSDDPLPPPYGTYALATLSTDALRTKGRYVRLTVYPVNAYAFVDEIEVIAGERAWVNEPYPIAVPDDVSRDLRLTRQGVYLRIRRDLETLQARMPGDQRLPLLWRELETLRVPGAVEGFRAIAPIGELHARVLAEHGRWLAAQGHRPLEVWTSEPYRLLSLLIEPGDPIEDLAVRLMNGERRPAAFNLTNGSTRPRTVRFAIEDLPGGTNPDYVRVFEVESVDTREGKVVASALLPLTAREGLYETLVPAGMTRQIWLAFEPTGIDPGEHRGALAIRQGDATRHVPLRMTVSPVTFPSKVDLTTATWDYIANMSYAVTPENQQAIAAFVNDDSLLNGVWATPQTLPMPASCDDDGDIGPIDFTRWDAYARMFPGKKLFVFAHFSVNGVFLGLSQGTPEFDRAIGQWAVAWAEHNRELGLEPGQAGILFIDEPGDSEWFKAAWQFSKPFNDATGEILVFNDPSGHRLDEPYGWELVEASDIVCPTAGHLNLAAPSIKRRLRRLGDGGRALWLYEASGPTRHFDTSHFRMQPWHVFRTNGSGNGFWAFGDTGRAANSWNGYPAVGGTSYAPVFIDPTGVHTSKHYEALREGVMDFQYLTMLRRRVAELDAVGQKSDALCEAKRCIDTAAELLIQSVVDAHGEYYTESWGNQSAMADKARLAVLDHIEALAFR